LLLKFERHSSLDKFTKEIKKEKNVVSWGRVYGKYDLYVNSVFKNEKELGDFISKLYSDKEPISDYFVVKPYFAELYPLKFFNHKEKKDWTFIGINNGKIKLDENDKKLLKILSKNGRARIIDIASELKISSELVLYKLKKFKKEGILLGSRIIFDMKVLGYYFSEIMINLQNLSQKNIEKIKRFARNSKHTNSLIISLTKPNCIIQLFHKEDSELRKTIEELKKTFPEDKIDIEIILIDADEEIRTLPFL
jgi:Lrp/AsnC family leucine-responsive transcriptional regulator